MDRALLLAVVAVATGLLSFAGTRALIPLLRRRAVLDQPNERSLHVVPTPRGGGIAVIGAVLIAGLALGPAGWPSAVQSAGTPRSLFLGVAAVPLGACLLAAVSWLDDLRDLAPGWRLAAQIAAVTAGIAALPLGGPLAALVGAPLAGVAAGIVWIWFTNLFNFMDGADGLAGSEAAAIGAGLVLFASVGVGSGAGIAPLAAAIAGAAVGFLYWNRSPARIFLGDVGSVTLGYVLGFLLIDLALRGWWKVALILPLYFLADATITLARRLLRGERVWQAHREHYYQRAVQAGLGHTAVVRRVVIADALLILCGWAAENGAGLAALAAAAAIVAILLALLARGR